MANKKKNSNTNNLKFIINAQYLKDLSFENPRAPESLRNFSSNPSFNIDVDVKSKALNDHGKNIFEVELIVKGETKIEDKKIEKLSESNFFENVEYKGIDASGNRYLLKSQIASFDNEKPELVNMEGMEAIFYFKDGTILQVSGKKGLYNNKTNDMNFRREVKVTQADNQIKADNLDYFNSKGLINIYGDVVGKSLDGNFTSDILNINIDNKFSSGVLSAPSNKESINYFFKILSEYSVNINHQYD